MKYVELNSIEKSKSFSNKIPSPESPPPISYNPSKITEEVKSPEGSRNSRMGMCQTQNDEKENKDIFPKKKLNKDLDYECNTEMVPLEETVNYLNVINDLEFKEK